ncbi:CRISPR-associated ring nuclease Csm6 [Azotobacter salinestris]|uniref:CRISPR-associated ring nuclease Csm6 n=1 Tax=Azotobacter salinestris TaxID=69964 RepID=UPI0032DE8F03
MTDETKPRHILLVTTGASPQVVTETLHAIHKENRKWPDEIRLITTAFGKRIAEKGLLEKGHLQRLCGELKCELPKFTTDDIKVVPDASGKPVEDARSLKDHEALADYIMTEVRDLTVTDKDGHPVNTLHASLAGGRKTMTFYLGYAMSLFGRREDLLSHVLISEKFEGNPGFWFPTDTPEHRYLQDRDGERIDASTAKVTLAPIPFIRHRQELPAHLRRQAEEDKKSKQKKGQEDKKKTSVNFKQLVELVNLGEQPEKIRLTLDLPGSEIRLTDDHGVVDVTVRIGLLELAFYSMMLRATKQSISALSRPEKGSPSTPLARLFLDELLPLCGLAPTSDNTADIDVLNKWNKSDKIGFSEKFRKDTFTSLSDGMKDSWFDQRRNKLNETLSESLPKSVCAHLLPQIIWSEDGLLLSEKPTPEQERAHKEDQKEKRKEERAKAAKTRRKQPAVKEEEPDNYRKYGGGYGIPLHLDNITLIEAKVE